MERRMSQHLTMAEICMDLGVPFYWSGSSFLINGRGAKRVVEALLQRGECIVGMEGYEAGDFKYVSLLDHIYTCGKGPWADARAAVSEWGEDPWVKVILSSAATEPGA